MNNRLANLLIYSLIGILLFETVLLIVSFLVSPYTGIRFDICGKATYIAGTDKTCIFRVEEGSPAAIAGIRPGDMVVDINGLGFLSYAYINDPDYLSSKNTPIFWEAQKTLSRTIISGRPLDITIERDGIMSTYSLIPVSFSVGKLFEGIRIGLFTIWLDLIIPYLLLRKKRNEITVTYFMHWALLCINNLSTFFHQRDIAYPYISLNILHLFNFIPLPLAASAIIHVALVFPYRRRLLDKYPWILTGLYGLAGLLSFIDYFRIVDVTTGYISGYYYHEFALITFGIILLYVYFRDKNSLYKKQILWVLSGVISPFLLYDILIRWPSDLLGFPIIGMDQVFTYIIIMQLGTILSSICFAIAVMKYRLLDIEELFDYGVIFSATLLILFGAEFLFLSALSPFYSDMLYKSPYLSTVPAVLLIVFIYIPIRNRIKRLVERLFKRGTYSIDQEMQRFVLSVGICSEISVFEN